MNHSFDRVLAHTSRPYLGRARARPFLDFADPNRVQIPEVARRIPARFGTWWEPYVGSGVAFFALDSRIRIARLFDPNPDVIDAYHAVRSNPEHLIALLDRHERETANDPSYMARLREQEEHPADRIKVAARYLYLTNPVIDRGNLQAASKVIEKAVVLGKDRHEVLGPEAGDFVFANPPRCFTIAAEKRLAASVRRWHAARALVMVAGLNLALRRRLYPGFWHHHTRERSRCWDGRKPWELIVTTYNPNQVHETNNERR